VYIVVGDGPQFGNIKQAVEDMGFQDKVYLLGRQPDEVLEKAYAASDLFVMPNIPVEGDMEGFGIVLLEANMAEMPAVASDLEGIRDVIANGKNGYRIPPEQAELFAEKVDYVLQDNLPDFAKKAREYVKQQFNWGRVADQYIEYLQSVVKS
jgi:phosphatidylinositol alpha-1,6-mannosyltransferase